MAARNGNIHFTYTYTHLQCFFLNLGVATDYGFPLNRKMCLTKHGHYLFLFLENISTQLSKNVSDYTIESDVVEVLVGKLCDSYLIIVSFISDNVLHFPQ